MASTAVIVRTMHRLLRARGAGKSICPSEVARALVADDSGAGPWREHMPAVREVAARLADRREVVVTQGGRVVDGRTARGPIRIARADVAKTAYADAYRGVDFRARPERYRIGKGEQGVLIAEPYKSELLPLWRFRTPEIARESAGALWRAFVAYRQARDFVGMDMARKFLQMGFTRARRYANRRSGRKYAARDVGRSATDRRRLPDVPDVAKAQAADVFHAMWRKVERDRTYARWRAEQARRGDRAATTRKRS